MAGSKMVIGWCLLVVGITFAARESSANHGVKGGHHEQSKVDSVALESLIASEVEYVEGPLAPLYNFLIQRRMFKFCKMLRDAQLEQVILDLGGSWTLFAPTDASFIFLPDGSLEELQKNPQLLRDFLLYHFVTGDFPSNQIQNEMLVDSVQGAPLRFNVYGQVITVSGAQILEQDLLFELGRVYIIDRPLYPIPSIDIISYLQRNHREFYTLLVALNLVEYISSGTFTVLAPEDDAFNYLSLDLKDAIATNVSLAERIIYNHILPGSIYIGGITDGMQWENIGGGRTTFTIKRGLTFADDIPIILPDVPLTNGVIHVLNRVMLPEGIEVDCQCKPSSETNSRSGITPGSIRPSFGQTQRPQQNQRLTTQRPGQSFQRETPRPIRGPQPPVQSGNRPWNPPRVAETIKPLSPSPVTRSPYLPQSGTQPDDDINSVVGVGEQPTGGQKRPDQTRTNGYPSPTRRTTSRPERITSQTTRSSQTGSYPVPGNENYPEQDISSGVTQTKQTDRWSNRQRTPPPRYPVPQQGSRRTPATTRRPQTTRTYDWNQRRTTQSSFEQPLPDAGSDTATLEPERVLQTQRPSIQTTNWQNRKQVTKTAVQPIQRTTFKPARLPTRAPQRRPTTQRTPSQPEIIPANEQSFESNRQPPTCRQQGERITPTNRNLPICSVSDVSGCQKAPHNPSDPRPICPDSTQTECRNPNDPSDPLDNRPLCQSVGDVSNCRELGQPTYVGDRRPLCSTTSVPQTGCRDPSEPFNPSDRRPVCRATIPPRTTSPVIQDIGSRHGCRQPHENENPQDQRPLCPEEPTQDCRSVLERPKPGDRRPLCPTSSVSQTGCKDPSTPFNPSDKRPVCPSSRPQAQVPPTNQGIGISQGCRRSNEITNPQDLRPLCPEETQSDCRSVLERPKPGDRRPLCTTPTTPQTGCKDPSATYNPSDRRPVCRPTGSQVHIPPGDQETIALQGCRRSDEVASPQDQRPICPEETQQECRSFLERPRPGDRRPVCKENRNQNQKPDPQKDLGRDKKKPGATQEQPYPQTGQTSTQTTRRQSWQSTTRSAQSWQSTRAPQSWQTTRAPQSWQSTRASQSWQSSRAPQSWQTTRTPQSLQSTTAPQSWKTTRASQNWQPSSPQTTKALQSWQTTRAPETWQTTQPVRETTRSQTSWQTQITTRRPIGKQPQRGSANTPSHPPRDFQTNPQSDPYQSNTGSVSNPAGPQSESYQPQSGEYPSQPHTGTHPQSGQYPSQPLSGRRSSPPSSQQPGSYPSAPNTGSYPSPPQSGSYPSQPQSGIPATPPQSGTYPSQPQPETHPPSQPQHVSSRPTHPQTGQGQFQPGRPSPGYPQRQPDVPQSQSRFTTPGSQPQAQGIPQPGTTDNRQQQPFVPQNRPPSGQGHQSGSFTTSHRRPTTTTRIPVSVTGTSTTPGEDSKRSLYEIVEEPSLLIRGRPVKLTKIFALFHKAGLEDILSGPGPTTVFLPSDDAFSTLPQGVVEQLEENPELLRQVLLYHVTKSEILPSAQSESYTVPSIEGTQLVITMVNGGRLILISGAKAVAVTRANNGIFYVINQLLYPLPHHDIVGAIQSRPDLSTLASLLPMSGLNELLMGQTAYTVLAPTDNAFAQLPQAVFDELTRNTTALQEILLNHVIEGAHYGREFITGGTFPSARGGKLKFQVVSYGYQVNEVNIKTPEIVTGTGVIHLVDQVILEDSDLRYFTALENAVAGQDDSNTNGELSVDPRRPISASVNPNTGNQQSFARQPQVGGLQPSLGQPNLPVGRVPGLGHQTNPGQTNVGANIQSTHGQQTPGRTTSLTGQQQPSVPGAQPVHGQQQSFNQGTGGHHTGQQPGQQTHGHQPSGQTGQSPFGGQRMTTHGSQSSGQTGHSSFGGQRQPVHGHQSSGLTGPASVGGQRGSIHGQRTQVGTFVNSRQSSVQSTGHAVSGGHQDQAAYQGGGQPNDVAELARSMGLNQFANWVSNTGLLEKIHDGGVYTVFAPTDDAVNSLPDDMVHSIESNPEQVTSILQYHIVPQRVNLNSVTNEETASTLLQGKTIRFNVYQNSQPDCKQLVTASGTPVGEALATMGSIQVIPVTRVLYQPTGNMQKIVEASPILQKLNEAVKSARLTWVLSGTGPLTIFAPSDTAFESLTEEERKTLIEDKQAFSNLLKRHMVRGTFFSSGIQEDVEKKSENNKPIKLSLQEGILTVNSVPVTYADITATNGVLHVIDQFLL